MAGGGVLCQAAAAGRRSSHELVFGDSTDPHGSLTSSLPSSPRAQTDGAVQRTRRVRTLVITVLHPQPIHHSTWPPSCPTLARQRAQACDAVDAAARHFRRFYVAASTPPHIVIMVADGEPFSFSTAAA